MSPKLVPVFALSSLLLPAAEAAAGEDLSPAVAAADPEREPTVRESGGGGAAASRAEVGDGFTVGFAGLFGAYVAGATAAAVQKDNEAAGPALAALLGGGAGGVAGLFIASRSEASPDQVIFAASTTTYGAYLGYQSGRALLPPGAEAEERRIGAAGVLGGIAGLGAGLLLAPRAPEAQDTIHADIGLGAGWVASTGINDALGLDLTEDRQRRAPIGMLTTAGFGALALGVAAADGPSPGFASTALGVGQGAWIGLWTPVLLGAEDPARSGFDGARIGAGAGYLASYGLAALGEPDSDSFLLQGAGAGLGNALGAGLPLLARGEDARAAAVVAPMLGFGLAGQAAGAALAPRYDLDLNDGTLLGMLGGWSAWQGLGWGVYTGVATGDGARGLGAALSIGGAGGLAAMAAAPAVDLSPESSALLGSAGLWGSVLGATTGVAAGLTPNSSLGLSLGVGDLAMLGTGVALAAGAEPSWGTVARVNGGLAAGGALGALGAVVLAYDADTAAPAATATLVGSAVGLTAGLLAFPRAGKGDHAALALPGVKGPKLPVEASFSASPWAGEDGSQGVYVSVQGRERLRR